jgi:formylglycine-generating enzyme required for sulfatase activity
VIGGQPADSIIVFATSAGKTAADGTGRNGLFTTHLLNNLKTPGLEVKEMFNRTGADVQKASNREQTPAVYNQFFGTVYLAGTTPQPRPQPQPTPQPIPSDMVRINGGTFMMGSPASEAGRGSYENQHRVTVGSFYMGRYEVTQKEYTALMGTNPSVFKGDNLPVENVSWYDAVNYCNALSRKEGLTPAYAVSGTNVTWNRSANGYRLPTEAEWEYACRAGTTTPFSTGSNITTNQANYDGNYPYNGNAKGSYRNKTTAVGSFAANAWGLYDMHGNVREWCWDWFGDYGTAAQTDPMGAFSGSYRVSRGGSWFNGSQILRSAYRYDYTPSYSYYYFGFRLVHPSL